MRKTIIALLLSMALLLVACAQQPVAEPTDDTTGPDVPEEVQEASEEEEPAELPAAIQDKIKRFNEQDSYSFYYTSKDKTQKTDRYHVYDTNVMIEVMDTSRYRPETRITNVYIDKSAKTAVGYCESRNEYECKNPEDPRETSYDFWKVPWPEDWINYIPATATASGSEQIDDRTTLKLTFEKDGAKWEVWMDSYSGVPVKVLKKVDRQVVAEHHYKKFSINTVTEDEVLPPQ